jgi:hypothetical protein
MAIHIRPPVVLSRENSRGHICRLVGTLGTGTLEQAMIQSWKFIIDSFEESVGPSNYSTVAMHV